MQCFCLRTENRKIRAVTNDLLIKQIPVSWCFLKTVEMKNMWQTDADSEGNYSYSLNHSVDCNQHCTVNGVI